MNRKSLILLILLLCNLSIYSEDIKPMITNQTNSENIISKNTNQNIEFNTYTKKEINEIIDDKYGSYINDMTHWTSTLNNIITIFFGSFAVIMVSVFLHYSNTIKKYKTDFKNLSEDTKEINKSLMQTLLLTVQDEIENFNMYKTNYKKNRLLYNKIIQIEKINYSEIKLDCNIKKQKNLLEIQLYTFDNNEKLDKYKELLQNPEFNFTNTEKYFINFKITELYTEKKDFKGSLPYFSKMLEIKPTPKIFCSRGVAYEELKDYKNAIKDFKSALALDESNSEAWNYLIMTYDNLNEPNEIQKIYSEITRKKLNSINFDYNEICFLSKQKEYEKAKEKLELFKEAYPSSLNLLLNDTDLNNLIQKYPEIIQYREKE